MALTVFKTDGTLPKGPVGSIPIRLRRHIRRRGEDCPAGAKVLPPGAAVTSVVQGLAASLGHDALPVRRRPRVAVLVTGDELAASGLPGAGRVRDALGPLLPGLVSWAGGAALADALAVVPPGWRGEEVQLLGLPSRL